jgi:hypothetical protein
MWATNGDICRLLQGPPQPDYWPIGLKFSANLALVAGQWYVVYSFFYRPMRDSMKRAILDRQRQGKFRIKTLAEWISELGASMRKPD